MVNSARPKKSPGYALCQIPKDMVSITVNDKVLSCLCGLARNPHCFKQIVEGFDPNQMSSFLDIYDSIPSIIHSLFLLYAYMMESMSF